MRSERTLPHSADMKPLFFSLSFEARLMCTRSRTKMHMTLIPLELILRPDPEPGKRTTQNQQVNSRLGICIGLVFETYESRISPLNNTFSQTRISKQVKWDKSEFQFERPISEGRNRQQSISDAYLKPIRCSEAHLRLLEAHLKHSAAHLSPI